MRNKSVKVSSATASAPIRVNSKQPFSNFGLGLFVDVSSGATLTYSVQYTYDQPEDSYPTDFSTDADWRDVDGLSGLSADEESNIAYPVNAVRLNVTSYTDGDATLTVTQAY